LGTRERLSELLERSGDIRGAVEILEPAVNLTEDENIRNRIEDRLLKLRGTITG
jgi:hypothetical protein